MHIIMKILTFLFAFLFAATITFSQNEGPEMVLVTGGSFIMGNDYSANMDEKPEYEVTLNDFYIGKYEVTNEEYSRFCKLIGTTPPSGKPRDPVENITWKSAVMYCNWLSSTQRLKKYYIIKRDTAGASKGSENITVDIDKTANGFRLPTEAEWEYAARGGAKSKFFAYSGSNNADDVAWFMGNAQNRVHEVGEGKEPNELGLYDMTGNCIEWCWDYYDKDFYKNSPKDNPTGPPKGNSRVCRGGNYICQSDVLRNTKRFNLDEGKEDGLTGIRLVKAAE